MNRFLYITGAALLIVAGVIGIARADFPVRHRWFMYGGRGRLALGYVAHELNLTKAQQTQIKSIWAAERPAVAPILRQFVAECDEMSAANTGSSFDEAKTKSIADKQAATVSQLLVERQRLISKIYSDVLTSEQRAKADQLQQRMRDRLERFLDHWTD